MNIEKEIFKKSVINFNKLKNYGFIEENGIYKYSKKFMKSFRADIIIDKKGIVSGKVFDLNFADEYVNFRIDSQTGEFVNNVRYTYQSILEDIRENCFEKCYFTTNQANRLTKLIINMYSDEPEFPWEKSYGHGIFRNSNNKKWYALIMNIDKSKIVKNTSGEIEALNIKLNPKEIPILLKKKGFYPAYHMNKKNWITIILDDTLKDEEIMKYIIVSHNIVEKKGVNYEQI